MLRSTLKHVLWGQQGMILFSPFFSKRACRTPWLIIIFISTGQAVYKGGPRCSTKPGFYFSSSFPFIFPPLSLFPLIHSSAIVLRIICLPPPFLCYPLSNWYQGLTSRPAEVKWYKVIGRSAQLTDWLLQVLLLSANQIRASPCGKQSHEHEASPCRWLMMLLVPV